MMRNLISVSVFLCGLFLSCNVSAIDETDQQESMENSQSIEDLTPDAVYFSLADFKANEVVGELENPRADYGLGLGMEYIFNDYLNIRYEMLVVERKYDTPAGISGGPFTVVSDDMRMSSLGISVIPVIRYAVSGFEFYMCAGLGFFWSNLTLTASTLGLPGSHEEKSQDYGTQTMVGVGYHFPGTFLGFELRQLNLKVNMAPVTSVADHDAGGKIILFVYRLQF
ncbi:MAG: hypothetical protein OQK47_02510 [Gammaproteobacteria bacterium]|nr:hypothetical protein [Gammaproteobacteria bacterium]